MSVRSLGCVVTSLTCTWIGLLLTQSEEWPAPRKLRRVLNIPRHPTLSDANPSISSTVILSRPVNKDASSRTQVNQDFLGRPLDLLPWVGVHCNSFLGSRSSGILLTWPNHLSLFAPNITSIDWMLALFSTSTFFTCSFQEIRNIFLRHRWWKTSSLWSCALVVFQTSLP